MSSTPYPAYCETGVEWIGRIPAHWRLQRLKTSTLSCQNGVWGDEPAYDTNDIVCVRVADFDRMALRVRLNDPTIRSISARDRETRQLRAGDLLLEKSGGGERQPVGTVVLYQDDRPAVCSNFIARIELAEGMVSSFWCYVHAAAYAVGLTSASIKQTSGIQNLDQSAYLNELAPFPPANEQSAIASFLNRETGKIDALVAEQERLIALLKEKRQAVISHAVTKGLNPNAPMKDSGVQWLGEVPAHWLVSRCGYYFNVLPGFAFPSAGFSQDEKDTRLLRGANVGVAEIRWDDVVYWKRTPNDDLKNYELSEGDLVLGMDRPWIAAGVRVAKLTASDVPSLLLQRTARISARSHVLTDLLELMLSSNFFISHFGPEMTGVSVPHISPDQIANFRMPIPPESEQADIVDYIREVQQQLDQLMTEAKRAIALLSERRAALISAAVTGKIDVRHHAASAQAEAA